MVLGYRGEEALSMGLRGAQFERVTNRGQHDGQTTGKARFT